MSEPYPSSPIDRPPDPVRPYVGPGLGVETAIIGIPAAACLGIAIRSGVDWSSPLADLQSAAVGLLWLAGAVVAVLLLKWFFSSGATAGNATIKVEGHLHGPPVDGQLTRRRLLATHEGGHAAVIKPLGGRLVSGMISKDNDRGLVQASFNHNDPIKIATFLYAGAAAAGTREGAHLDYKAAEREIKRYPRAERAAADATAKSEAARLVRVHRAEIERIAGVLVVRGRI